MNVNNIPFMDFGGSGELIHFAHANGFPVGSYKNFIAHLSKHHKVVGMNARPMWKNADLDTLTSWHQLTDDLIRFLDAKGYSNIIGMGHSFGAVITLLAAQKRPDLFRRLILIEPVVLPKKILLGVNFIPISIRKKLIPVIKTALNRTDLWESQQEVFSQFRIRPVFANISDEVLWDYVKAGTVKTKEAAYTLKYSKEWEAQVFSTIVDPWKALKAVKLPILTVRGENTDVLRPEVWSKWKSVVSNTDFLEIPGAGHLVPFEKPEQLASGILGFLQQAKL